MLPFLKPRQVAGVIISNRKPDGAQEMEGTEGNEDSNSGLHACAGDLIRAIHSKDEAAVASAIKAAFDILESQPHEEENEQPNAEEGQE